MGHRFEYLCCCGPHRCQGKSSSCFPKGVVAEGKRFMKGVSNLKKGGVQSSSSLLGRELPSFSRQSLQNASPTLAFWGCLRHSGPQVNKFPISGLHSPGCVNWTVLGSFASTFRILSLPSCDRGAAVSPTLPPLLSFVL